MAAVAGLWAEKPRRVFEWGFDLGAGLSNSAFALGDIFNESRVLKVDLEEFGKRGFDLATDFQTRTFFSLNIGETWAFQLYGGADALFYGSLSREITEFLAEGNSGQTSFEGSGGLGISVFADAGLRGSKKFGKWTVGLNPAAFVPILYASQPDVKARLDTGASVNGALTVAADLYYSVFPLDTFFSSSDITKPAGYSPSTDIPLGVDLSGSVEYELFSFLDVGGAITHLPLVPAIMSNRARMTAGYAFEVDDLLDAMQNGGLNFDDIVTQTGPDFSLDDHKLQVFRPLRFDAYGRYKAPLPLSWLKLSVKPTLGFSILTVYGDMPCFNWSLEGRLALGRIFFLSLGTGLRENIWRQSAMVELNFRALELDIGISSQSPDFLGSLEGKGLGLSIGLRLGW
jgi:hypothetical protein